MSDPMSGQVSGQMSCPRSGQVSGQMSSPISGQVSGQSILPPLVACTRVSGRLAGQINGQISGQSAGQISGLRAGQAIWAARLATALVVKRCEAFDRSCGQNLTALMAKI